MPPPIYPTDIIAAVGEKLSAVGSTAFGEAQADLHRAPRTFIWTMMDSPLGGPMRTRNDQGAAVDSAQLRFAVRCWGHSVTDAWWMVCALLTALKKAINGRQYEASQIVPVANLVTNLGYTLGVVVELHLHIPAVDLGNPPAKPAPLAPGLTTGASTSLPLPPPAGPPAYGETDQTTALAESVGEATPATSTPGDGVLEGQET